MKYKLVLRSPLIISKPQYPVFLLAGSEVLGSGFQGLRFRLWGAVPGSS